MRSTTIPFGASVTRRQRVATPTIVAIGVTAILAASGGFMLRPAPPSPSELAVRLRDESLDAVTRAAAGTRLFQEAAERARHLRDAADRGDAHATALVATLAKLVNE